MICEEFYWLTKKLDRQKDLYTLKIIIISINFILINTHLFKHDNNILSNALKEILLTW